LSQPILDWCRDEYERAKRYWEPIHEAILAERSFIDGQHYSDDSEPHENRPEYLRFVGQETSNVTRHKAAQLTDTPRSLEARSIDRISDPNDAEVAVQLLEWELGHPQKGFDDCADLMANAAIAARVGVIWLDFDPDLGRFGEITFRPGDAAKVMWEPGFHDPHHLHCSWLREERTVSLKALKGWGVKQSVLDELKPEQGVAANRGSASNAQDKHEGQSTTGEDQPLDSIRVAFWWKKNDPTVKTVARQSKSLAPADRFMVCGSPDAPGCSWMSDKQGDGPALPEATMDGCPECGGPTMRVDERLPEDEVLAYPKGKRLVIECLSQSLEEPLYDGDWPTIRLNPKRDVRGFPLYVFTAYLPTDPTKPVGDSDTYRNWSAQVASDYLMTKGFQAASQYQRYYLMPETGINDANGMRFEFRDDQFNVMFRNPNDAAAFRPGENQVQAIDGSSFDPNLPAYWSMVQNVLLAKQGLADFGFKDSADLKSVTATTAMQATKQADIPMDHLKRRWHRALARGHGVLWDYICATYTNARLARLRLGDDDEQVYEIKGDELPNFDFVISDVPTFSGLEKAKTEALDALTGRQPGMPVPPEWLDLYAEVNELPPSIVRRVKKKLAESGGLGLGAVAQPGQAGAAPIGAQGVSQAPNDMMEMAAQMGGMGLAGA